MKFEIEMKNNMCDFLWFLQEYDNKLIGFYVTDKDMISHYFFIKHILYFYYTKIKNKNYSIYWCKKCIIDGM